MNRDELNFVYGWKSIRKRAYDSALAKGFHAAQALLPIEILTNCLKLFLIVSELVEAFEAIRKGNPPDKHLPQYSNFAVELADAAIRIADLAEVNGIPLEEIMLAKMDYNDGRPQMHGDKLF